VARILFGEALSNEDVTEMSTAGRAQDFCSATIRIRQPSHRTRNFVIEARPAAATMKLAIGTIQGGITATTKVHSFCTGVGVLSGKGTLRPFPFNDKRFFRSQPVPSHG